MPLAEGSPVIRGHVPSLGGAHMQRLVHGLLPQLRMTLNNHPSSRAPHGMAEAIGVNALQPLGGVILNGTLP